MDESCTTEIGISDLCSGTDVGVPSSLQTAKVAKQSRSVRPTLVTDKAFVSARNRGKGNQAAARLRGRFWRTPAPQSIGGKVLIGTSEHVKIFYLL